MGESTEPPTPRDIRAYWPKRQGQQVHYFRKDANHPAVGLGVQLAVEHGFKLSNPELQASLESERTRKKQERAQANQKQPVTSQRDRDWSGSH